MMRCDDQTYFWDEDGPNTGGPTTFTMDPLSVADKDEPVGLSVFCIELWSDPGPAPVELADVVLSLVADNDGDTTQKHIRVVDRTTGSVEGQVSGRLVVAFPRPFPVPMSPNGSNRRMGVMLDLSAIAATCDRWTAWLAVVRGEARVYGS